MYKLLSSVDSVIEVGTNSPCYNPSKNHNSEMDWKNLRMSGVSIEQLGRSLLASQNMAEGSVSVLEVLKILRNWPPYNRRSSKLSYVP